ncbi:MAG: DUF2219 family protein [Alphaproteobacteria bacterium]|nr:DUF2219 family protein [Alphaproteobacteria bacterium]
MLASFAAAALALAPTAPAPPPAEETPRTAREDRKGSLTFVLENDAFGTNAPDKNYTNGVGVAWMSPKGVEPAWMRALADLVPPRGTPKDARIEVELGQVIYTPEDLSRTHPDPVDRPYAGILYAAAGLVAQTNERTLDQTQLVVGVVGPASQAGDVQSYVHRQLGAPTPYGWDAQIPNRVVAAWRAQRTDILAMSRSRTAHLEILPTAGVSLGNLQTSANIGLGFRLGAGMPLDFGPPRLGPGLPGAGYFSPRAGAGWYAFGGVDGRYVAYDVSLDERSALGAKVSRRPWVGDVRLGLAGYVGDVRIAYTQVWRTREFREQRESVSDFGAISVTVRR